jgi:hypothetical protein
MKHRSDPGAASSVTGKLNGDVVTGTLTGDAASGDTITQSRQWSRTYVSSSL